MSKERYDSYVAIATLEKNGFKVSFSAGKKIIGINGIGTCSTGAAIDYLIKHHGYIYLPRG